MLDLEIRSFSMKRGGTHAITDWIIDMYDSPLFFIDDCRAKKVASWDFSSIQEKCVFLSFQNKKIYLDDFPPFLSQSNSRIVIIILRDLLNWAASLMIHRGGKNRLSEFIDDPDAYAIWGKGYNHCKRRVSTWKHLAENFLNADNIFPISFNHWFLSESYRKEICIPLNLEYSEATIDMLSRIGGGSSFDGVRYSKTAQSMDVLNRWKVLENNKFYLNFLRDNMDSVELSNRIFGTFDLYL